MATRHLPEGFRVTVLFSKGEFTIKTWKTVVEPTTEWEALVRGILDTPEDDAPRLVYADWCDDHDEPKLAAVLRTRWGRQMILSAFAARTMEYRTFPRVDAENLVQLWISPGGSWSRLDVELKQRIERGSEGSEYHEEPEE